jgi:hypothetical protein
LITTFALTLLTSNSFGNELYKWVDSFGNVTYTDSPPPDSAQDSEEVALGDIELVDENSDEEPKEFTDQFQQQDGEPEETESAVEEQTTEDQIQ